VSEVELALYRRFIEGYITTAHRGIVSFRFLLEQIREIANGLSGREECHGNLIGRERATSQPA
jgi:hypothetical protein